MDGVTRIIYGIGYEILKAFNEASFYILLGIIAAGLIQIFLDSGRISRYLGKASFRSVLMASLIGVPLPLCSCGVIPAAVSLKKNGASRGSILSFLISTPESGLNSIAISYAFLDPLMTVFRPFAAFITAILAGVSENIFSRSRKDAGTQNKEAVCCCSKDAKEARGGNLGLAEKLKQGMSYAFGELLADISKWLLIGILAAGVMYYFLPPDFFASLDLSDMQMMLVMLVAGIPLYICASASTPIAAVLISKGITPGAALVFLLAGPATNISAILAVKNMLGGRSLLIYLFSISVCSILLGMGLNHIYYLSGTDIAVTLGSSCHLIPDYLKVISSLILGSFMFRAMWKRSAAARQK